MEPLSHFHPDQLPKSSQVVQHIGSPADPEIYGSVVRKVETAVHSNIESGKNYITYSRRETSQFTMEEGRLLEAMHSHLEFLNTKLGKLELTSFELDYEEVILQIDDLRKMVRQLETVLEQLRRSVTEEYQFKVSEIEWFIMMLKQRFDNVGMLALGLECCDDEDEELDFMNSLDYQGCINDDD